MHLHVLHLIHSSYSDDNHIKIKITSVVEQAVCAEHQCANGGVCILDPTAPLPTKSYMCLCDLGYTGRHCTKGKKTSAQLLLAFYIM